MEGIAAAVLLALHRRLITAFEFPDRTVLVERAVVTAYPSMVALLGIQTCLAQYRHRVAAPSYDNRLLRLPKCAPMTSIWMVYGWQMDGIKMADTPYDSRSRVGETEKLTINLGVVDLGQIDLLVQEGFYSNRTDLIRTAIRNQLTVHGDEVKRTVARRTLVLGLQHLGRAELERAFAGGQMLHIRVLGLARIANDVAPELARATIQSVEVLGAFHASPAVRRALADRIL